MPQHSDERETRAETLLERPIAGLPAPGDPAHAYDDAATIELGRAADAQLARGFGRLRFEPALEQVFEQRAAPLRLSRLIISGAICLGVYNGFLVADLLLVPDAFAYAATIRLGLYTPAALICLATAWWVQRQHRIDPARKANTRLREFGSSLVGLVTAGTMALIILHSRSPYAQIYHGGFVIVVLYSGVVQRLRFRNAAVVNGLIFVMQLWTMAHAPMLDPKLEYPMHLFLFATIAFTLVATYRMEREERTRYLLRCRERALRVELAQANATLDRASRIDALTGVASRRHFHDYLERVWARATDGGGVVSLVMLDVDCFKAYNDHYGHPAGDACLRQIASALQHGLRRPGDLIARFGGEEFIAVLPETSAVLAARAADRIRLAVEALALRHEHSACAPCVTVSMGVAAAVPGQRGSAIDTLIAEADAALYQAKSQGRNRVCIAGGPTLG